MRLDKKDILIYNKIRYFCGLDSEKSLGYCNFLNQTFSENLGIAKENVSRKISKLIKYGLIKNIGNKQNRRLVITEKQPPKMLIENDDFIKENDNYIKENDDFIIEIDVLLDKISKEIDKPVKLKLINLLKEIDKPVKHNKRINIIYLIKELVERLFTENDDNDYINITKELRDSYFNKQGYKFLGYVIKLKEEDFNNWREKRKDISFLKFLDVLIRRDHWLSQQDESKKKSWFISTSKYLEGGKK